MDVQLAVGSFAEAPTRSLAVLKLSMLKVLVNAAGKDLQNHIEKGWQLVHR